jgi:hypothetical protein
LPGIFSFCRHQHDASQQDVRRAHYLVQREFSLSLSMMLTPPVQVSCLRKKNPDVAELVRGKTGRVYGSLVTLLTVMKGLPLAYNKDMQEDKECVFDAVDTVQKSLLVMEPMLATMKIIIA